VSTFFTFFLFVRSSFLFRFWGDAEGRAIGLWEVEILEEILDTQISGKHYGCPHLSIFTHLYA
jgi:hypothetical protein